MTDRVSKRIFNVDIKNYTRNNLDEIGIYIHFNEENIRMADILIIGPEDTPYEGGYYTFNVEFTDSYPFKPPKVHFNCLGPVRIHPNLYRNGKVCLSILGTWAGPSWTSVMDISIIAKTIQSLLSKNAIHHEPGYQTENGLMCTNYDRIITFINISHYILEQVKSARARLKNTQGFDKEILEHFSKNNLLRKLNELSKQYKKCNDIQISIYNISCVEDYNTLLKICDKC